MDWDKIMEEFGIVDEPGTADEEDLVETEEIPVETEGV